MPLLTTKNTLRKHCFGSLTSRMQHLFISLRPKYVPKQHETKKMLLQKQLNIHRFWNDRKRYSIFALEGALVDLLISMSMKMTVSSNSRGNIFQAVSGLSCLS